MGYEVSIDSLKSLYRTGKVTLPVGAASYSEVAQAVHATSSNEGAVFGGPLGTSPVQAQWTALRDLFQDQVVVRTQQNIVKSGEVLAKIAIHFGEQDGQNKTELDKYRENLDQGKDENGVPLEDHDRIPPVPDAPTSGNERTDPNKVGENPETGNPDPSKKPEASGPDGVPDKPGGGTPMPDKMPWDYKREQEEEDGHDPTESHTD